MELAADLTPERLHDVLAELHQRVAPTTMASERVLPVHPALMSLFPDGGLVRGRVHACDGSAGSTLAMLMVRDALLAGGWLALVDVPAFGVDAANELGLPLERLVRVDTAHLDVDHGDHEHATDVSGGLDVPRESADDRGRRWLEVMAAAIDGFDVVVTAVPPSLRGERSPAAVRTLVARLQQRGAIVIVLGPAGVVPIDITISSSDSWSGLGDGHGLLQHRRLEAVASGRRQPGSTTCSVDLAGDGRAVRLGPAASGPDPERVSERRFRSVPDSPANDESSSPVRLVAG